MSFVLVLIFPLIGLLDVTIGGWIHRDIICFGVGDSLLEIPNFTTLSVWGIFTNDGLAIKRKLYSRKLYICNVISFWGIKDMKIDLDVLFTKDTYYVIFGYRFQRKVIKHRWKYLQ